MGFDMYDANNDDQISDLDLFKIFQHFGQPKDKTTHLFRHFIHNDLVTMTKIMVWKRKNKEDALAIPKEGPEFMK